MFESFQEARKWIDDHGIQAVDMKYCDLWGAWHHITVPVSQFTPALMDQGIGFDGSSVGLKNVKAGDMVLMPELETGFLDPFWEQPTLSFICITLTIYDIIIQGDSTALKSDKSDYFVGCFLLLGRRKQINPQLVVDIVWENQFSVDLSILVKVGF